MSGSYVSGSYVSGSYVSYLHDQRTSTALRRLFFQIDAVQISVEVLGAAEGFTPFLMKLENASRDVMGSLLDLHRA
jgi:hypothetical protein